MQCLRNDLTPRPVLHLAPLGQMIYTMKSHDNYHNGRHLCLITKKGREQAKQAHIPRRLEQRARENGADYHFIRLEKRPSVRRPPGIFNPLIWATTEGKKIPYIQLMPLSSSQLE